MTRTVKKYQRYEVVRAFLPPSHLSSARVDGDMVLPERRARPTGFYLVLSKEWRRPMGDGHEVRHFGPFATADVAKFLQTSAIALGLVEAPPVSQPNMPSFIPPAHLGAVAEPPRMRM